MLGIFICVYDFCFSLPVSVYSAAVQSVVFIRKKRAFSYLIVTLRIISEYWQIPSG